MHRHDLAEELQKLCLLRVGVEDYWYTSNSVYSVFTIGRCAFEGNFEPHLIDPSEKGIVL